METVTDFTFLGSKITADGECSHEMKRCLLLGKKAMANLDSILKSRDINFADKGLSSQSYGSSSSHVWIRELDYKESRVPKNWCFWTVVLEKTLESPWTARRSNQSILKEISPEYSLEGLMLKLQYFSHLMWTADSIEKTLMLGNDCVWEEKGMTEDEMVGWHPRLNGHEFEQALGDSEGQGGLACCSPWSCKELGMIEQLNNSNIKNRGKPETKQQDPCKREGKGRQAWPSAFPNHCLCWSCYCSFPFSPSLPRWQEPNKNHSEQSTAVSTSGSAPEPPLMTSVSNWVLINGFSLCRRWEAATPWCTMQDILQLLQGASIRVRLSKPCG